MTLKEQFDGFIEESIANSYPPGVSAIVLCSEDCTLDGENLREALHRVKVRVAGGGFMTKRTFGRKDPRRSMIAKRSARKGRAKRMAAMRNPRSKMKRRRTMAARKRLGGSRRPRRRAVSRPRRMGGSRAGAYRGHHGAVRHGAPRVHRPKVRRAPRPKAYRPRRR